ncbi:MAG: glucose 1-dehydrogenase [Campylobacteraceae bacterium]|nr:glucose 1-dehydrogenase [Campylobacteraceae bacterium]
MRLKNKVAIVTGGTSGIGAEISKLFVENGAKVAVVARKENAKFMQSLGENAKFFSCDVACKESVVKLYENILKEFGKVDILVNNAGITGPAKPSYELTFEEWQSVINLNINGTFLMSKYALLEMTKQKSGSIINIASVLGMVGSEAFSVYTVTKGAVISMSKQDALSVAKYGVRVNAISPATVKTEQVVELEKTMGSEAFDAVFNSQHPLGGVGEPKDVAYAALYLASNEAKWVTGSNLVVDGGFTAK